MPEPFFPEEFDLGSILSSGAGQVGIPILAAAAPAIFGERGSRATRGAIAGLQLIDEFNRRQQQAQANRALGQTILGGGQTGGGTTATTPTRGTAGTTTARTGGATGGTPSIPGQTPGINPTAGRTTAGGSGLSVSPALRRILGAAASIPGLQERVLQVLAGAPAQKADVGLTQAKTATERERPGLVRARAGQARGAEAASRATAGLRRAETGTEVGPRRELLGAQTQAQGALAERRRRPEVLQRGEQLVTLGADPDNPLAVLTEPSPTTGARETAAQREQRMSRAQLNRQRQIDTLQGQIADLTEAVAFARPDERPILQRQLRLAEQQLRELVGDPQLQQQQARQFMIDARDELGPGASIEEIRELARQKAREQGF